MVKLNSVSKRPNITSVAKRAPVRCVPAHTCSATAILVPYPEIAMVGDKGSLHLYVNEGDGFERIDVSSSVSRVLVESR